MSQVKSERRGAHELCNAMTSCGWGTAIAAAMSRPVRRVASNRTPGSADIRRSFLRTQIDLAVARHYRRQIATCRIIHVGAPGNLDGLPWELDCWRVTVVSGPLPEQQGPCQP